MIRQQNRIELVTIPEELQVTRDHPGSALREILQRRVDGLRRPGDQGLLPALRLDQEPGLPRSGHYCFLFLFFNNH